MAEVSQEYAKNLTHHAAESVATRVLELEDDPIHYETGGQDNFMSYNDFKTKFNALTRIAGHGSSIISVSDYEDMLDMSDVEEACEDIELEVDELDLLLYAYGSDEDEVLMDLVRDRQYKHREKLAVQINTDFKYADGNVGNATFITHSLLEKFTSRRRLSSEESLPENILPSDFLLLQEQVVALRKALPMHTDFLLRRLEVAKQEVECSSPLDCAASELEALYNALSTPLTIVVSGLEGLETILSQIQDFGTVLSSTSRLISNVMVATNVLRQ